jgi:hypothetical protein
VKAHADAALAASDEEHSSFKELKKWLAATGITIATVGGLWKAIKLISSH